MIKFQTIFLSSLLLLSCKGGPTIRPQIMCDVSFQFDRCRCRCYDVMNIKTTEDKFCGETFQSGNYPIESCEGVSGFKLEQWANPIIPFMKEGKRWINDRCE